ncbi:hypothetical protein [Streptantibioticus silvisoli]|uniref:Uncharacterized protein n=1 Tax=Streptantibioticus silvisoli TaxID=2705255 RepID=A0ABT6W639_9ACTN|nr:hypothetical protein [Streptantibioticus silvisoli]MDI5964971.1 hypothetical protein [Streptantibioticus silvisoli]
MSGPAGKRDAHSVQHWAETVLRQLRAPTGATIHVSPASDDPADRPLPAPGADAYTSELRLPEETEDRIPVPDRADRGEFLVRLDLADASSTTVFLPADLADADAVAQLAGQLQDSVLESTGGAPEPPCPVTGHGHPAVADVVDGTACWTCPAGGPTRPVLRGAG